MIFGSFSKKGKLGIDIGTSSIKILELDKKGGRFELLNYGLFELKSTSSGPSGSQGILRLPDEQIVEGIQSVTKKANIKAKDVVASIPSFSTFATVIEMPYLSEDELAKSIPYEARKYIPIPLEEVILDWSIIDVLDPGKLGASQGMSAGQPAPNTLGARSTTVEIFIAAVPREETTRYQSIMQRAGLNLRALELENSALVRALLGNDMSTSAIVNIGGRSTSIIIVDHGYERVSHNYEVGGFEITKTIAQSLGISSEKAEELKRRLGMKPSDENIVEKAMTSLVDMMAFETKKTITNYEDSKGKRVTRTLLVGGLVNMPHFLEYFKQKIGRDVFLGNTFSRIMYPQALAPAVPELSNAFAVAAGLAMREI